MYSTRTCVLFKNFEFTLETIIIAVKGPHIFCEVKYMLIYCVIMWTVVGPLKLSSYNHIHGLRHPPARSKITSYNSCFDSNLLLLTSLKEWESWMYFDYKFSYCNSYRVNQIVVSDIESLSNFILLIPKKFCSLRDGQPHNL